MIKFHIKQLGLLPLCRGPRSITAPIQRCRKLSAVGGGASLPTTLDLIDLLGGGDQNYLATPTLSLGGGGAWPHPHPLSYACL